MGLSVQNLRVSLGTRTIVANATFDLTPGEFVVLLGPNGAGKTTLLRGICGLIPMSGTVSWQDTPLAEMPARKRAKTVAYLPQGHVAHWPMSVRETVAIGRFPYASSLSRLNDADETAIDRALHLSDAGHLTDRDVTTLSGGERARVMLARALAVEAPVLLADEPIAALDPEHQLAMATMLTELARDGRAVLAVMHDLAIASRYADRVLIMQDGRLVADGPPSETLTDDLVAEVFHIAVRRIEAGDRKAVLAWEPIRHSGD